LTIPFPFSLGPRLIPTHRIFLWITPLTPFLFFHGCVDFSGLFLFAALGVLASRFLRGARRLFFGRKRFLFHFLLSPFHLLVQASLRRNHFCLLGRNMGFSERSLIPGPGKNPPGLVWQTFSARPPLVGQPDKSSSNYFRVGYSPFLLFDFSQVPCEICGEFLNAPVLFSPLFSDRRRSPSKKIFPPLFIRISAPRSGTVPLVFPMFNHLLVPTCIWSAV